MKNVLMFGAALAAVAALAPQESHAQTTNVGTTWNGAGAVGVTGNTTNSTDFGFTTGGNLISGSTNYSVNSAAPYGYGVQTVETDVDANVANGGFAQMSLSRIGSYVPLYGDPGQKIMAFGQSNNGSVELVSHGSVNYASMNDLGYGQNRTSNGKTIEASGGAWALGYEVDTGVAGNESFVSMAGSGSGSMVQNFSSASEGGFGLGRGGGIFTTANLSATGIGQATYGGVSTNQLNVHGANNSVMGTAANPASFTATINFGAGLTWNDFSLSGVSGAPAVPPAP